MAEPREGAAQHGDEQQEKFESILPVARRPKPSDQRASGAEPGELDLELGDIETRLPYGSEDIADK